MDHRSVPPADPGPNPTVVAVVGAGTMGAGIAQVALEAGDRVLLYDPDPDALGRAIDAIRDGLERRRRRSDDAPPASALVVDEAMARLDAEPDLERTVRPAKVVVEAVYEELDVKQRLFSHLDETAPPSTILATNTSALSVGEIAAATRRPGRVLGLHFFNPAPLMPLIEVVVPPAVEPRVAEAAMALVGHWGKVAVRTADTPGFIVNRVNRPFTLEALWMLETGEGTVESIDDAVRAAGFPTGPFELMDLVGIDVNLAAARGIFEGFAYEPRFRPSQIQERLVEAGRLGRKTREGFYWYAEDGRRLGVAGAFAVDPVPGNPPDPTRRTLPDGLDDGPLAGLDQTVERIVLAIIDEAYQAVGDGTADAGDIDLAIRLGAGHPMGPFERTSALGGPVAVLARLERYRRVSPRLEPAPALVQAATTRT